MLATGPAKYLERRDNREEIARCLARRLMTGQNALGCLRQEGRRLFVQSPLFHRFVMKATYQSRIKTSSKTDVVLSSVAALYGHVERSLFAAGAAGESFTGLKRGYLLKHGISSRLFNSVRTSLDGKVRSVKAGQKRRIADLEVRIRKAKKTVRRLE